jgi:hypothetical protein
MKLAALLCPGPSLRKGLKYPYFMPWLGGHDPLVLCVNKARHAIDRHDWWIAGDAGRNAEPESITDARTYQSAFCNRAVPGGRTKLWSSLGIPPEQYSAVAALHLAAHLLCTHVVVEGADMHGDRYYDGSTSDNLNNERWARERYEWNMTVGALKFRGIDVVQLNNAEASRGRLVI